jgi:uroporphyrin-III C-methyltransferase
MITGFVSLVGAGPGDPELLTLKGLRRLRAADVVVYDALVNRELLCECRPGAELIDAGKRAGQIAHEQESINTLLIARAQASLQVVRLKGGDPFVFGRGGEEAAALAAAGVPWEAVPGVTSAIGVPAYAGIPVTHRALASSVAFITGHEDPDREESRLRWQALAQGIDTLVFLMAVGRLGEIATQLIAHGRPADTPAALIRWGTTPDQETVTGTLATIAADVARAGLTTPALLVVGEVVRLREQLSWFDTLEQLAPSAQPVEVAHW